MPTSPSAAQGVEQPPALPPLPAAPSQTGSFQFDTRAMTQEDVKALLGRKEELSDQIRSATSRRNDVNRQLDRTPQGPARAGLEARLVVLDQRIVQLETDIAANGRMLAAAPAALRASESTSPPQRYGPFSSGQLTAITIVSLVMVWAPLAYAAARVMLRRWGHARPAPQVLESAERLERMEQAVDAVAIEIERISEGQRFVTQLLAKAQPAPAITSPLAPPV